MPKPSFNVIVASSAEFPSVPEKTDISKKLIQKPSPYPWCQSPELSPSVYTRPLSTNMSDPADPAARSVVNDKSRERNSAEGATAESDSPPKKRKKKSRDRLGTTRGIETMFRTFMPVVDTLMSRIGIA